MPLKEKNLIRRIRQRTANPDREAGGGIGDDCAVLPLPSGHEGLVTTDFCLEGVHFRRAWHPADTVGHRCLARGLSDIAAMGGVPRAAFLSLALPADTPQRWVDGFISGFLKLAKRYAVVLAGGDTAQSPHGVMADVMVFGSVPAGTAILRSGARAGDLIYVTGRLGDSVRSLQDLREGKQLRLAARKRHFYPDPRLAAGQYLREKRLASAMIDISDGLSTDLDHICEESEVGAVLFADAIPALPGKLGLRFALHGGEDYELLFAARADRRIIPKVIAGVPLTRIGEITRRKGMRLMLADGTSQQLEPQGWEHFACGERVVGRRR